MFEVHLPSSRVRRLNSHDVSVENKRRKYTRKRELDQQHDGGQKIICLRKEQQQVASSVREDTFVPGPPPEVLRLEEPFSAGTGREGRNQAAGSGAHAAPAEPVSGACSPAV